MFIQKPQRSVIVESTLLIIKPDAIDHQEAILATLQENGFLIEARSMVMSRASADMLADHYLAPASRAALDPADAMTTVERVEREKELERIKKLRADHQQHLMKGTCLCLILTRENAVAILNKLCGPNDPEAARKAKEGLRARYGTDEVRNALHSSDTFERAEIEIQRIMAMKASQRAETVAPPSQEVNGGLNSVVPKATDIDMMLLDSDEEESEINLASSANLGTSLRMKRTESRDIIKGIRKAIHKLRRRELDLLMREQALVKLVDPALGWDRDVIHKMRGQSDTLHDVADLVKNPLAMRQLFDSIDLNGNGYISRQELDEAFGRSQCLGMLKSSQGSRFQTALRKLGQGDKNITYEEFCIVLLQIASS